MNMLQFYLILSAAIFVLFAVMWKADDLLNIFIKFIMIYMAIQGFVLAVKG